MQGSSNSGQTNSGQTNSGQTAVKQRSNSAPFKQRFKPMSVKITVPGRKKKGGGTRAGGKNRTKQQKTASGKAYGLECPMWFSVG
jgi:hypothetical protein